MPELNWTETTPLHMAAGQRRHGSAGGESGVSICEIRRFQLVLLLASRGQSAAMRKKTKSVFGSDPGAAPGAVAVKNGGMLIWSGPDQFYAMYPREKAATLDKLKQTFAAVTSISDQSGSRSLIRMSGPRVRDCLAKMVPIDLHPAVFRPGDAAATRMGHIAVSIWRDAGDNFNILVSASFADTLWRGILDHGAEYGVEIVEPVALG